MEESKVHNHSNSSVDDNSNISMLPSKRAIAEGDEQFNQNKKSRTGDVDQCMEVENFDHNSQMEVTDYTDSSEDQQMMITGEGVASRSTEMPGAFQSAAADSDAMWETILPPDYREIIANTASFSFLSSLSKKDLFFHLCRNPLILDNGTMSFALDKQSGKKCYMIGARALSITWSDTPTYWRWIHLPESRFNEVAELRFVWWLDVWGAIQTNILSPNTMYVAYLVFKFAEFRSGFEERMAELGVIFQQTGAAERRSVYLDPPAGVPQLSRDRGDEWMEIEMGSFFHDNGDEGAVICRLKEVNDFTAKRGLIVEGIEFRPKDVLNS